MLRMVCMDFVSLLDVTTVDLVNDSERFKSMILNLAIRAETGIPITITLAKEPDERTDA